VLGGPLVALLHESIGRWIPLIQLIVAMELLIVVPACPALKPMRRRHMAPESRPPRKMQLSKDG